MQAGRRGGMGPPMLDRLGLRSLAPYARLAPHARLVPLALVLTGCVTAGGPAAPAADMPLGTGGAGIEGDGIAGRRIAGLDTADRRRAIAAEYQALEFQAVGDPISWQGGAASGEVTALAPFQVGSQNCRQLVHRIAADGDETVERGSACRDASGRWSPLD